MQQKQRSEDKVIPSSRSFVSTILRFPWAQDLCLVPDEYIQDRFNLIELPTLKLQYGKVALSIVCGHYTLNGEKLCSRSCSHNTENIRFDCDEVRNILWKSAVKTYFFIHQRWLQTINGQFCVKEKYMDRKYGQCPKIGCTSRGLLPGIRPDPQSIMNNPLIKFCPHCNIDYDCDNLFPGIGDAFGPNFIASFLMTYWNFTLPNIQLEHKISGFRISPKAFEP